jgi:methylenetetrahydrofolate dehydrogenase (NADP+)/methenyltetrahydrofolate cyclohydrolase
VDFAGVAPIVRAISPVPGGVGPMTIAKLLKNTLQAARATQPIETVNIVPLAETRQGN